MPTDSPLDEEALLNFDRSELLFWSQEEEDGRLAEHHDLFVNHLLVAKHLEFWASNLRLQHPGRFQNWVEPLLELAAHLRLGHYLPGGDFYDMQEPHPWARWEKEITSGLSDDWPEDPPRLPTSRIW